VFVGRLVPFKGIPFLLEAIARVRNEVNVHLTIVGEGPEWPVIQKCIDRFELGQLVTMTGNLPLPQVAERMRNAHLFCLPSVRESGGAVLLEAMASAVPVVAVNYGGPAEIVDDEVGRLLPADGPEPLIASLADTLREVVRNPEDWRARGETGRRRAEQTYGWDAKVSEMLELYRQILNTV
jgi:glycosyltransferase involved in cell wall biosynthesis